MKRPFLIDISRLFHFRLNGRQLTGIDRVTLEYVRHYAPRARAVLSIGPFSSVLSEADSRRAFRYVAETEAVTLLPSLRLVFKACLRWLAGMEVKGCTLLKTGHPGHENPDYNDRFTRRGARLVSIIYDRIPATHPEYCRPGERERHLARLQTTIAASAGLVAISRDTLDAVTDYAKEADMRMPPAIAAPLASGLPPVEAGPRPIAEPYFVTVGTIEPRKNHLLLLQIWRELLTPHSSLLTPYPGNRQDSQDLQDSGSEIQGPELKTQGSPLPPPLSPLPGKTGTVPRLVIVGRRGWECENVVDLLERCEPLRGIVIERGACGDAELVTYLRHAQALLFPTFAEGYGMPIAEALSLGTPVIASDLPVFREVAGEISEYVDPLDGARWMKLIVDYASPHSARRAAQIERMKNFHAPTWDQHFEKVNHFLERETGNGKWEMGKSS